MAADQASSFPMPLTLLICDAAYRDAATGKWTLLGLFNSIHARTFPTTHAQMIVYLAVTDANGKVPLRFQIVDSEENEEPLFKIEAELTVSDPRVAADVVIPIRDVTFPKSGEYRLQVFACNQFLIERRIMVLDSSPTGNSL